MKHLKLTSPAYQQLLAGYKNWLSTLGYSEPTVYGNPNHINGYLHWQEQQGRTQIKEITKASMREYYQQHLKNRSNQRTGGALSNAYLNKQLDALEKLSEYLRQSGRLNIPSLGIRREESDQQVPEVLTEAEIRELYRVCEQYPALGTDRKPERIYQALALRDKAMLALYYGCGLRRSEGIALKVGDIYWEKKIIHITKSKNNRERMIPISAAGLKHLQAWQYEGRPQLQRKHSPDNCLLSERGTALNPLTVSLRFHQLVRRVDQEQLNQKEPTLHTLRHSIATHLLANGMALEKIKEFLGHNSLESTQIYTRITE